MNGEQNAIDLARTTKALKSPGAIHNDLSDAYNYMSNGIAHCYFHCPEDLRKAAFKKPERFTYNVESGWYEVIPSASAACIKCSK